MKPHNRKFSREDGSSFFLSVALSAGMVGAISYCMGYHARALTFALVSTAGAGVAWLFNRRIK